MKLATILVLPLAVLVLSSCEGEDPGVKGGSSTVRVRRAARGSPLLEPDSLEMNETAPGHFRARFRTSQGEFVIAVHREWAPYGADRFYNLVKGGFYDKTRFFRVISGFVAQWGIHGNRKVADAWMSASIPDDVPRQSNTKGTVTYAMGGKNTRTTQVFVNLTDNSKSLDQQDFAPFGVVIEGMDVVEKLYSGYGDGPPQGAGADQTRLQREGNAYLAREFPLLDYVLKATVEPGGESHD